MQATQQQAAAQRAQRVELGEVLRFQQQRRVMRDQQARQQAQQVGWK